MNTAAESSVTSTFDVIILGASFAGLEVYHQLRRKRRGRELAICMVDRQALHGYIPLVQERLVQRLALAATALETQRVVQSDARAQYVTGEVVAITGAPHPHAAHVVQLAGGETLSAAALVVALGSTLGPPPALPGAEHLLGYKFACELSRAQRALHEAIGGGTEVQVVVVGGGVSGVELAGELAHYARKRASNLHVSLIESGPRLLKGLSAGAGRAALQRLTAQGARVRLNSRVLSVSEHSLRLQAQNAPAPQQLSFTIAFWAAGVRPIPLLASLGLPLTDRGYLRVNPSLQSVSSCSDLPCTIFACGDAVRIVDAQGEWPTMQRAIECLWQAKIVAKNLLALRAPMPLRTHTLRRNFPYGVSIGARSLVVYRGLWLDFGALGVWFRRFLMRQYFKRYRPAALPDAPTQQGEARRLGDEERGPSSKHHASREKR